MKDMIKGWVCPACGAIHAPVTTECWCSKPRQQRAPKQMVRWASGGREPDYVYDQAGFQGSTYTWCDRDLLARDRQNTKAVRSVGTLFQGPDLYLISVKEGGETVDKWFSSLKDATDALKAAGGER